MIYFTQKLNRMCEGAGLTEKICVFRLKNMKMKNIQSRQKGGHIVNLLNTIPAKGIRLSDFENKHSGREKISKITELQY